MKTTKFLILPLIIFVVFFSCDLPKSKPALSIEGVWELEHADWYYGGDTVVYPNEKLKNLKSRRIISHRHYSVITQDSTRNFIHAAHGRYYADGIKYIEQFELHKDPKVILDSVSMNYTLQDEYMIISNEDFVERWKRIQ